MDKKNFMELYSQFLEKNEKLKLKYFNLAVYFFVLKKFCELMKDESLRKDLTIGTIINYLIETNNLKEKNFSLPITIYSYYLMNKEKDVEQLSLDEIKEKYIEEGEKFIGILEAAKDLILSDIEIVREISEDAEALAESIMYYKFITNEINLEEK